MKVLVAGAGAIGQWLGARLQDAGHAVQLLTTQRHVAALRALRIDGLSTWSGALDATADPNALGTRFDAAFLVCKAHQTQLLAPLVAPRLAPGAVLATLQNGFGNAQKVAHFLPPAQVAVALTSHGIWVEAPGQLRHAGVGATQVGPFVPDAEASARTAEGLLADAALAPEWHAAMRGFVWRKAMINHAVNPVAALHGVPNGEVLAQPTLHSLSSGLLKEAVALAERGRVPLPPGDLQDLLDATLRRTAANRVSMLQDVDAKRATEVEQITGRMVRLAERLLVSMPRSESVYGRIKDLEASYLGAEAATRLAWDELPWEAEPF
ncbi:MAG: 2-dehydropantoate 2-reductase [Candidatus Thermoplasmatota archaeon]